MRGFANGALATSQYPTLYASVVHSDEAALVPSLVQYVSGEYGVTDDEWEICQDVPTDALNRVSSPFALS